MQNDAMNLSVEQLLMDESPLSPAKELAYRTKISDLAEELEDVKQQLANLKKMVYGQKSEKTEIVLEGAQQISIFNEAEANENQQVREKEKDIIVPEHKRKAKRTHEEMLEDLPVEEIIHEAEDRSCPVCQEKMETVGKDFVRDELVYVPARLFVRKHYVEVLKCPTCGTDESKDADYEDVPAPVFRKATAPNPMIPHSFCSPELLAHILYEKYVKAVPLERQSKDLKAMGVKLSTATLSNWVIYAAKNYFAPICAKMKEELLKVPVIHADETVVQVLNEPGRKATTDSRMWVYCAGAHEEHSNILFEYQPTRNGDHAKKFLEGFMGYLVCDGFDGYNKLTDVTRCGCWAHARRKFVEALPTDPTLLSTSQAAHGLEMCNQIFELEREYSGKDEKGRKIKEALSKEERQEQRQERTKPILEAFFAWLNEVNPSGGTKLSQAVQYCRNEQVYLSRFLENGMIPVDNNRAENAIRPFVQGRKNWLFSTSVRGAEASAMIYSLAATATANGLNVEQYFTDILSANEPRLPW